MSRPDENDSLEVIPDRTSAQEFHQRVAENAVTTSHFQDRRFTGRDVREVLKELFYNIQVDLGITPDRWERLVTHYVNQHATDDKTPTEIRSAIKKNFMRAKQMTLAMFARALKLLPVVSVRLGVTLVFANRKATHHGIWFNINDPETLRGLDDAMGDVHAPVRYLTELSHQPGANAPIIQHEGDAHVLEQLAELARRQQEQ